MGAYYIVVILFILHVLSGRVAADEPVQRLNLTQVLELTFAKNPELKALTAEINAREGALSQAKLLPNPEFNVFLEDFAGSKTFDGFERSQTTFQLSQLIELGGERSARKSVAIQSKNVATQSYLARRNEILTEVAKTYFDALRDQENYLLTQDLKNVADEFLQTAIQRVEAGKVSPIEQTKAGASAALMQIELLRSQNNLEKSRKVLAAYWSEQGPSFSELDSEIEISEFTISNDLEKFLQQNPEVARAASQIEQQRSMLKLQKSISVPNLVVSGGYRRLSETDDHSFVAQVSVPLPLFNRNQGNIAQAQSELMKSELEKRAVELRISSRFAEVYSTYVTASAELNTLKDTVLPAAQESFSAVSEGYRLGKFNYLEMLDAQRTLFESRKQNVRALAEYRKAIADLLLLMGKPLGSEYFSNVAGGTN